MQIHRPCIPWKLSGAGSRSGLSTPLSTASAGRWVDADGLWGSALAPETRIFSLRHLVVFSHHLDFLLNRFSEFSFCNCTVPLGLEMRPEPHIYIHTHTTYIYIYRVPLKTCSPAVEGKGVVADFRPSDPARHHSPSCPGWQGPNTSPSLPRQRAVDCLFPFKNKNSPQCPTAQERPKWKPWWEGTERQEGSVLEGSVVEGSAHFRRLCRSNRRGE